LANLGDGDAAFRPEIDDESRGILFPVSEALHLRIRDRFGTRRENPFAVDPNATIGFRSANVSDSGIAKGFEIGSAEIEILERDSVKEERESAGGLFPFGLDRRIERDREARVSLKRFDLKGGGWTAPLGKCRGREKRQNAGAQNEQRKLGHTAQANPHRRIDRFLLLRHFLPWGPGTSCIRNLTRE